MNTVKELSKTAQEALIILLVKIPANGYFDLNEYAQHYTLEKFGDVYTENEKMHKGVFYSCAKHADEIYYFLTREGFALSRGGSLGLNLTDKGRELREAGSLRKYFRDQKVRKFSSKSWKVINGILVIVTVISGILSAYFASQANKINLQSKEQRRSLDSLLISNKILHDSIATLNKMQLNKEEMDTTSNKEK